MEEKHIKFYLKFHKEFRKYYTLNSALKSKSLQWSRNKINSSCMSEPRNKIKKEIEEIYLNLSHEIKQKIRNEATKRAKTNSIRYGKSVEEYNSEEWREILRKEEEELKKEIWKKGGIGMLSFTLFPWLWF